MGRYIYLFNLLFTKYNLFLDASSILYHIIKISLTDQRARQDNKKIYNYSDDI